MPSAFASFSHFSADRLRSWTSAVRVLIVTRLSRSGKCSSGPTLNVNATSGASFQSPFGSMSATSFRSMLHT